MKGNTMKRFSLFLLMLALGTFTVGCGGESTTETGPDLEVQENLEEDLADQEKMMNEAP